MTVAPARTGMVLAAAGLALPGMAEAHDLLSDAGFAHHAHDELTTSIRWRPKLNLFRES